VKFNNTLEIRAARKVSRMRKKRMRCDQCEMLSINGTGCHETGCPNSRSRYDEFTGEWIKQRVCFPCGCTVDADDACCQSDELLDDVELEESEETC
jgi:hypothetical protein